MSKISTISQTISGAAQDDVDGFRHNKSVVLTQKTDQESIRESIMSLVLITSY